MTAFPGVDDTAEAAAEIQAKIGELPPIGGSRVAMRIGFHFGPAIENEGDVFGDSVNVAARMVALAKGGQVITSAETVSALAPWLRGRFRELDSLTVKGKTQDIRIFELLWQESPEELTALSTRPKLGPARLWLRLGEREIELGESRPGLTLGRDPQSDVVIADKIGIATPRADRAATRQIRAGRPKLERHLCDRRRRTGNPPAARRAGPPRSRPDHLRPRRARGLGRCAQLLMHRRPLSQSRADSVD